LQSCGEIADIVKIPGRNHPKANILQLIHNWLKDEKTGKWVIILDNVDDSRFLRDVPAVGQGSGESGQNGMTPGRPLLTYLPITCNGSILVTSRNRDALCSIVEDYDIIAIKPMKKRDARMLLEKKLGAEAKKAKKEEIMQLVTVLESMPLAIAQAAAYIRRRAPRMSVLQYLKAFQESDCKKTNLLKYESKQLRRDTEAENAILATWQISFDHIQRTRPSAADLISHMSFFDRQGIPESLLRSGTDRGDGHGNPTTRNVNGQFDKKRDSATELSVDDDFENDILTLRNYSFISVGVDYTTFVMHRLVQLATRNWLVTHKQLAKWKKHFIEILSSKFPTEKYENWAVCELYFSHVQSAVMQRPDKKTDGVRLLQKWAELLHKASRYALKRNNLIESEKMATLAMETRTDVFDSEDHETLESIETVALSLGLRSQWAEAEKLHTRVMETRKRNLGRLHSSTVNSIGYLATLYSNWGRWEEADKFRSQLMEISTRLGPMNPNSLVCKAIVASTYWIQGQWKKAEELEVHVMLIRIHALKLKHPDTLTSINNLASTYQAQGRWEEANNLRSLVIPISKKKLGTEHPNTLASITNLASSFCDQGRWQEAEKLEVQVMQISKQVLGPEHPHTLTSISNLASIYCIQGRWKEAEKLEVRVMQISKKVLGLEHNNTLASMGNLASTYWNQRRWKEAERLNMQAMQIRKQVLGLEHPKTLVSISNLASIYRDQGQLEEAEELNMQVMQISKQVLGPKHPDTLASISNLALTYLRQERWKEAEKLEVQAMQFRQQVLGLEHPDTLTSISNLALTYLRQGRRKEAEKLNMQAMQIRQRVLGQEHPDTLISRGNLASTYWNQGRWKEAEELWVQVIRMRKQVLGLEHPYTLLSMSNLASTYRHQRRWKEAEELNMQVMQIRKKVLGPKHPDTLFSMESLAMVYWNESELKEAEELQVQVVKTSKQVLGPKHLDTLIAMGNLTLILMSSGKYQDALLLMAKFVRPCNMDKALIARIPWRSILITHVLRRSIIWCLLFLLLGVFLYKV
jgi:tetratricopeptide (TPR) repeat protein